MSSQMLGSRCRSVALFLPANISQLPSARQPLLPCLSFARQRRRDGGCGATTSAQVRGESCDASHRSNGRAVDVTVPAIPKLCDS